MLAVGARRGCSQWVFAVAVSVHCGCHAVGVRCESSLGYSLQLFTVCVRSGCLLLVFAVGKCYGLWLFAVRLHCWRSL